MARTDQASKLVAAPPERVYAALVDPEALARWLPPGDMTAQIEHYDARPGGTYRMVLTYPDPSGSPGKSGAGTDVTEGRFVDLVEGARVVYTVDFVSTDAGFAGTMTMSWQLTPVDGATRVDITAEDVPDAISAADHAAGMASSLDNLAVFLGEPAHD